MDKKPLLIILGVLLLCGCIGCSVVGALVVVNSGNTSTEVSGGDTVNDENPKSETGKTGEATVGDLKWEVLTVENLGSTLKGKDSSYATQYFTPEDESTSGKYIQVKVRITNNGTTPSFLVGGIRIADSQGREFDHAFELYGWINENERDYIANLNPDETATLTRIFDVPKDANGLQLIATNGTFNGEEVKINLDL